MNHSIFWLHFFKVMPISRMLSTMGPQAFGLGTPLYS